MHGPPPELDAFGRTLRRQRRLQDLSQEALAHHSGVSSKHISEIERAQRDPGFTTVVRLSRGLRLPASELVAFTEQQLDGS